MSCAVPAIFWRFGRQPTLLDALGGNEGPVGHSQVQDGPEGASSCAGKIDEQSTTSGLHIGLEPSRILADGGQTFTQVSSRDSTQVTSHVLIKVTSHGHIQVTSHSHI